MTEKAKIIVEYKDKKNSSGRVIDGVMYLSISNCISLEEKEEHIRKLTERLQSKINWAKNYNFDNSKGIVKTNEELNRLAATINKAYYSYSLNTVEFHKQYSTWGTCSLKFKNIYISNRLIGASLDLVWYVLVHEICHLAEPSHNQHFWNLVSKACPNYQECRKMLKAYGMQLNNNFR